MFLLLFVTITAIMLLVSTGNHLCNVAAPVRRVRFASLGVVALAVGIGVTVCGTLCIEGLAIEGMASAQERRVEAPPTPSKEAPDTPVETAAPYRPSPKRTAIVERESSSRVEVERADADAESTQDASVPDTSPRVEIDYGLRPDWVDSEPLLQGDLQTVAVCTGPFRSKREADAHLAQELKRQTDAYVDSYVQFPGASKLPPLNLSSDDIRERLLDEENVFGEKLYVISLDQDMWQTHALLEFDGDFRSMIDDRWESVRKTSRLTTTAIFGGGLLLLLCLMSGYFKMDSATRGFYTVRLQFVTAVAILAVVAAGVLLARWYVPWI